MKAYSPGVDSQWAVAQPVRSENGVDKYMPPEWRHRIALYADDMAAGANTLEELFEIYKAGLDVMICYIIIGSWNPFIS